MSKHISSCIYNKNNIPSAITQVGSEEGVMYADLSLTCEGRKIVFYRPLVEVRISKIKYVQQIKQ